LDRIELADQWIKLGFLVHVTQIRSRQLFGRESVGSRHDPSSQEMGSPAKPGGSLLNMNKRFGEQRCLGLFRDRLGSWIIQGLGSGSFSTSATHRFEGRIGLA